MVAPSRLGRYPVRRRIGAGAFATVWLAYDEHLDCPVAIKVLADNWTSDHHVRRRFVEEGRFLRKVESPHVVSVYDAGELDDGRPFLVMAYADQGTLADRLELAPLTRAQALHVVTEVGEGLHALHQRGVLHRDVKPANVLFRTVEVGGRTTVSAMVGDLGLGKALDMSSRLTMIAGTPAWVAPEQAQGEPLDGRADQYSLAALTYLLLTGRPAYSHASLSSAAHPGPLPEMAGSGSSEVPEEVEAVVARGLSVDREARYADVPAYVAALGQAVRATGGDPGRPPEAWIALDPDLTRADPRAQPSGPLAAPPPTAPPPTASPPTATATRAPDRPHRESAPRRRPARGSARRRAGWGVAAVVALLAGVTGGWALHERTTPDRTVADASGTISVTVPEEWATAVDADGWTPPGQDLVSPAVSAGTGSDWRRDGAGLFVGLLRGTDLPRQVPQHTECSDQRPAVADEAEGDPSITVVFTECPGVTVERVVHVTSDQLLWVQVRSDDRATANRVLDAVELHGM